MYMSICIYVYNYVYILIYILITILNIYTYTCKLLIEIPSLSVSPSKRDVVFFISTRGLRRGVGPTFR